MELIKLTPEGLAVISRGGGIGEEQFYASFAAGNAQSGWQCLRLEGRARDDWGGAVYRQLHHGTCYEGCTGGYLKDIKQEDCAQVGVETLW
jgi:hypothetical protein